MAAIRNSTPCIIDLLISLCKHPLRPGNRPGLLFHYSTIPRNLQYLKMKISAAPLVKFSLAIIIRIYRQPQPGRPHPPAAAAAQEQRPRPPHPAQRHRLRVSPRDAGQSWSVSRTQSISKESTLPSVTSSTPAIDTQNSLILSPPLRPAYAGGESGVPARWGPLSPGWRGIRPR